ncbi:MAG TPA: hypothetical protein VFY06_16305 [Verrucomicrobiae bacterium]|nr:hypothetical protein [Verrucomicrobiae bacterium]
MNGTAEQTHAPGTFLGAGSRKIVAGGALFEGIGSAAAIVLTILGLAKLLPADLTAVAVIGIGISLLFEGGTVGARFSRLLANTSGNTANYSNLGGGLTAEFMAGATGIVLGLLSLLGVAPTVLPPVAVMVFGGAMLLGSGAAARLSYLEITSSQPQAGVEQVAHEAVSATVGAQVLTGMAAVILGILALVGISPVILTLVALLCLGTAVLINGSAISSRILNLVA